MTLVKSAACIVAACVFVLFSPVASAQSSISGQARDSSGAVMAGVSVEASSPALIEKSRTVTTNGEGRYAIVDVRPGTYTVTFTMSGFSTVKQQIEVPSNVTVPVDGVMQVGSIGQVVEVQAAMATVDVDNAAHSSVLTRNEMDALPTSRNPQSMGSYTPGVHLNQPDVGGSQQIEQTYMVSHGNPSYRDTYLLDGMMINTTQADGQIQIYVDNALVQEVTYQNTNVSAEVTGGGVVANFVPREGGNILHGNLFLGWIPSSFVGSNIDTALTARGVTGQSAVTKIEDFDGSVGGPVKKDKLWFLVSGRKQLTFVQAANSFYVNGAPGVEQSYIYSGGVRLTYQINSKHKFAAMWTRDWKTKEQDVVTGGQTADVNPLVSSLERKPKMYYILQGRWTGTLTPRLLVQAGATYTKLDYNINYHDGVQKTPFTPAWFAGAQELDQTKNARSIAGAVNTFAKYDRAVWNASGTYVTGSHQVKFGIQDSFGVAQVDNIANGDAYYNYTNGVPLSITAFNTPTYVNTRLNHDLGLYAMDTWRFKRLSVTAGLRWEYLSAQVDPQSAPAGRFTAARNFQQIDCTTIKGMSCFKNWAPRIGLVYDVFGNHKTAVKMGFGKYNSPIATGVVNNFNPMTLRSQTIQWLNRPTTACQSHDPTGCFPSGNGFSDGDIGPNPNPRFGQINGVGLDPNYHREYQIQYNIGVQRELMRGVTLNFTWNHGANYQAIHVENYAVPASAWTPFQISNPLDGSPITVFNLQPSYFGLTPALHQTNAPQSLRTNVYNGYEVAVTARLPHGAFLIGGWTIDRLRDRGCDMNTDPLSTALNDPNSLRFCDWNGSLYQDLGKVTGIPYRNEFKLQGNLPIKWGIEVNGSLYSDPVFSTNYSVNPGGVSQAGAVLAGQVSGFTTVLWPISPTARYPADCTCPNPGGLVDAGLTQGAETIALIAPGSRFTPRLSQLDIGARKVFHIREKFTIMGEAQFFNVTNSNAVLTESYTLGTSVKPYLAGGPGGVPTAVLNPRMMRLNLQFKF
jgi:hypothetical protein